MCPRLTCFTNLPQLPLNVNRIFKIFFVFFLCFSQTQNLVIQLPYVVSLKPCRGLFSEICYTTSSSVTVMESDESLNHAKAYSQRYVTRQSARLQLRNQMNPYNHVKVYFLKHITRQAARLRLRNQMSV